MCIRDSLSKARVVTLRARTRCAFAHAAWQRHASDRRSRLRRNCHIVVQRWRLARTPGGLPGFLGKARVAFTRAHAVPSLMQHAPWQILICAGT
eukprot:1888446-Alexandrium_andersonii.AAC.1